MGKSSSLGYVQFLLRKVEGLGAEMLPSAQVWSLLHYRVDLHTHDYLEGWLDVSDLKRHFELNAYTVQCIPIWSNKWWTSRTSLWIYICLDWNSTPDICDGRACIFVSPSINIFRLFLIEARIPLAGGQYNW